MKRLLTILLFIVCVLITILIVKIDDYAYVIYPSHNNLPSDNVNNKLENNNNNDNENNNYNTNNDSNNDFYNNISSDKNDIIDDEIENKDKENVSVDDSDKENNNDNNNNEDLQKEREKFNFLNKYLEKADTFNYIENNFQVRNSTYIPWEKIVYDKDVSYKYDNNGLLEWIEVNDVEKVFGKELKNYNEIKEVLGKAKIFKKKNNDLNYNYYELSYEFDDINIRFLSYYESGNKNICIID